MRRLFAIGLLALVLTGCGYTATPTPPTVRIEQPNTTSMSGCCCCTPCP